MTNFSWTADRHRVQWRATLHLNVMRAFAAGLVWAVIVRVLGGGGVEANGTPWWSIPFLAAIGYVWFIPTYHIAAKLMRTFAGDVGDAGVRLGTIFFALLIAAGDPIVFLLHRKKPAWVPVERFSVFNFTLVLYVMDPRKLVV